jgi:2-phospho-L-lactate guanylyltransferase (CobY/MobA/RfbA family)
MATIVVPFRPNGKSRLSGKGAELSRAMLEDVLAACRAVAPTVLADREGGQGEAVQAVLAGLDGPVAIVNADLPCATPDDVERLLAATPPDGLALVEAVDGTTNALSLADVGLFQPLYGPGSAERFRASAPSRALAIDNLVDDVDTPQDLVRLADRLGPNTRAALA